MKRLCVLIFFVVMLTGCSAPVWETVSDMQPAEPVAGWSESLYQLQVDIPEQLVLVGETDNSRLFETPDGSFSVETSVFLSADLNSAVKIISGFSAEKLTILKTSFGDLPEYQFVWHTQTAEGGRMNRAGLIMDGSNCYAVVCSAAEMEGNRYEEQTRAVFWGFSLSSGETV